VAKHNEIGKIGEDIASKWLTDKGFLIIERNYLKKWGEIDIVARLPAARLSGRQGQAGETAEKVHFVEVKAVSHETKRELEQAVSHLPTGQAGGTWRPEEKVHKDKQDRLKRAIQTWLAESKYEGEWQIDVIAVRVVPREKYCTVKYLENVIFE
jgi:putative endonuclease